MCELWKGANSSFRRATNKAEGSRVENGQEVHDDDENEQKASCPQYEVQETNKLKLQEIGEPVCPNVVL